jgi:predicted P-loop ATPase
MSTAAKPALAPKPKVANIAEAQAAAALKEQFDGALIHNTSGGLKPCLANALAYLRFDPAWRGVLRLNQFSLCTIAEKAAPWGKRGTWSDTDDSKTAEWLQQVGVGVNSKTASEAVQVAAEENGFHPIRDYLRTLEWDQTKRLDHWLHTYLGVQDTPWSTVVGPRYLVSAVARVEKPGCQADHCLLAEGPQGINKSTALRTLASDEFFADHISDLGSKDSQLEVSGIWIMELAELDRVRSAQLERVKSFLVRRYDRFRSPYGRRVHDAPRQCVFAATVNHDNSLTDETGNRRFWPIRCGSIDIARLSEDRDQLWAEAFSRYQQGQPWWLESGNLVELAKAEQAARFDEGVWDDRILQWLENPVGRQPADVIDSFRGCVTVTDVLLHAIGKSLEHCDQKDKNAVSRCLVHAGYSREQCGKGVNRGKWFYVKGEL